MKKNCWYLLMLPLKSKNAAKRKSKQRFYKNDLGIKKI